MNRRILKIIAALYPALWILYAMSHVGDVRPEIVEKTYTGGIVTMMILITAPSAFIAFVCGEVHAESKAEEEKQSKEKEPS